jgi:hypothetical protein
MTYWITKWWATKGIIESPSVDRDVRDGWHRGRGTFGFACRIGKEAFPNRQEAQADVRKKAARKAARVRLQLLRFERIASGEEPI